jgi:hypothetical protein
MPLGANLIASMLNTVHFTPSYNASSYSYSTYGNYSINDYSVYQAQQLSYVSILWDFGDSTTSGDQSILHKSKDYTVANSNLSFWLHLYHKITFTVGKGYLLVVPNAFTPNNDINDTFRPVTKESFKKRSFGHL